MSGYGREQTADSVPTRRVPSPTMSEYHQLQVTSGPGGLLFECEEGCGRRLVVDRVGKLTVIDRGDPYALHKGSTGGLKLKPPVISQP
jgi:hypothetical protein